LQADRERGQAPGRVSTEEVVDALNDLLQLEYDALGAYELALENLPAPEHREQLELFRRHHERHVQELNMHIHSLGGSPANEPHATGPLKQALQGLGALGGARGTLIAYRSNELQIRDRYTDCVARAVHWPPGPRKMVERHAVEEERHVRWATALLERWPSRATRSGLADMARRRSLALAGGVAGFGTGLLVGRIIIR
jgi:rubrerythrin